MMCVIWKLLLVWLLFLALGGCGNQDLLHLSACNSQRLTAHVLWADTNAEDYALMATVYSYMLRLMPMFPFVSISYSIRVNFAVLPLHNVWILVHFLHVYVCICMYCLFVWIFESNCKS